MVFAGFRASCKRKRIHARLGTKSRGYAFTLPASCVMLAMACAKTRRDCRYNQGIPLALFERSYVSAIRWKE